MPDVTLYYATELESPALSQARREAAGSLVLPVAEAVQEAVEEILGTPLTLAEIGVMSVEFTSGHNMPPYAVRVELGAKMSGKKQQLRNVLSNKVTELLQGLEGPAALAPGMSCDVAVVKVKSAGISRVVRPQVGSGQQAGHVLGTWGDRHADRTLNGLASPAPASKKPLPTKSPNL